MDGKGLEYEASFPGELIIKNQFRPNHQISSNSALSIVLSTYTHCLSICTLSTTDIRLSRGNLFNIIISNRKNAYLAKIGKQKILEGTKILNIIGACLRTGQ
jgi:hypothetical protein